MKRMSSRTGLILVVLATAVVILAATAAARTNATKTVTIGWAFDSKGAMAPFDNPALAAAKLRVAQVNARNSGVKLQIPVREGPGPGVPTQIGGVPTGASPLSVQLIAPRLASDRSRTRRFPVKLVGSLAVDHYQIDRFHGGGAPRWTRVASNVRGSTYHFNGQYGGIYTLRARAIGKNGKAGPWSKRATTIVPLDDRVFGFFGSWVRLKRRWAWVGSVNRATGAGDTATYSFRSGSGKLYLIGRTAPEDGNATATLDGRKTKVSFHASKVHHRAVVAVLTVKKARRHSLRLRTLGPIDLDGIALSVAPSPAIR